MTNATKPRISTLLELKNGITIDVIGNPHGRPIVFLCGWGMSTSAYHERLEELGEDFHIYAISLPGFGHNDPIALKNTNVPDYAALLAETIDHLGLPKPFIIMGHSTGGGVATLIAKQHPDWISDVVLITPIGSAQRAQGATKRLIKRWMARSEAAASLLDMKTLRRNAVHATVLAWNATRIDLIDDVVHVIDHGTPVHMFLSRTDDVAPPGALGDIEGAAIHWVNGGHNWFRENETEFTDLMRETLIPSTPHPVRHTWGQRIRNWARSILH